MSRLFTLVICLAVIAQTVWRLSSHMVRVLRSVTCSNSCGSMMDSLSWSRPLPLSSGLHGGHLCKSATTTHIRWFTCRFRRKRALNLMNRQPETFISRWKEFLTDTKTSCMAGSTLCATICLWCWQTNLFLFCSPCWKKLTRKALTWFILMV